ncbi:MAG: trehalose-phosphatase [Candidatus Omnitrophica bacterium]|nr:trehalose-phosphatase [Candidatus Omnitrophota bacterium]
MRHLFSELERIKNKLKGKYLYIFLDYDGTLTPIARTPNQARISQEAKNILKRLARCRLCKIAIISGRALKDIRSLVGLRDIIYVGNHGFELAGPKIKFQNPLSLRYRKVLEEIKKKLNEKISLIKGAFVEDKGLSLSLHYRLVKAKDIPKLEAIFHETVIIHHVKGQVKITSGKKVLEVRLPGDWGKGRAALWLLARQKFLIGAKPLIPIYIGDDASDEDAFLALKNKGLTVFVGSKGSSDARYYLNNPNEVQKFLQEVISISDRK